MLKNVKEFARLKDGKWYEQEHKDFQICPMWFMFCCFEVYKSRRGDIVRVEFWRTTSGDSKEIFGRE